MKYFDQENKRLIYIKNSPNEEFWTKHWLRDGNLRRNIELGERNGLVKRITEKFLKKQTKVFEGGCGIGQNVYGLSKWGYEASGVDFAEDVIKRAKECFPNLRISVEDVRRLDYPNECFDGYWSLGVIEHFTEGYEAIIKEAGRVLKKGGYIFLTFPWMSPLRKFKAKMNLYPRKDKVNMSDFYEFMLDDKQVVKNIETHGFRLIFRSPSDAVKGLKDEIPMLRPILQKVYDSGNIFMKAIRFIISVFFAPFAGHIILLVFKKTQ